MTPPGPGIWFGIDPRVLPKFSLTNHGSPVPLPPRPELQLACMICGGTQIDAESNERHPEYGPDVWELWTYCKKCDCWTEHQHS